VGLTVLLACAAPGLAGVTGAAGASAPSAPSTHLSWGAHDSAAPAQPASGSRVAVGSGYDMVGSDGGVFVFNNAGTGFYGSLPGIGIHIHNVVGMVGSDAVQPRNLS
jgi:hypothetical protein